MNLFCRRISVYLAASVLAAGSTIASGATQDAPRNTEPEQRSAKAADGTRTDAALGDTNTDPGGKMSQEKTEQTRTTKGKEKAKAEPEFVRKTDAEWRKILTRTQYMVTRQKATEPAFSGKYATGHYRGTFLCVCCDAELFSAGTKFDSGTGWPSFDRPASARAIAREMDYSSLEPRVEVTCRRCGAHLGHVFDDGPTATGLRFCINSAAIKLRPPEGESESRKASSSGSGSRTSAKARTKTKATTSKSKAKAKGSTHSDQQPDATGSGDGNPAADGKTDDAGAAKPLTKPSG